MGTTQSNDRVVFSVPGVPPRNHASWSNAIFFAQSMVASQAWAKLEPRGEDLPDGDLRGFQSTLHPRVRERRVLTRQE
jgi:hypothetical protein